MGKLSKKKKFILGFILGIITSIVGVYATVMPSDDVEYSNQNSNLTSTSVQGAIDELYTKEASCRNS